MDGECGAGIPACTIRFKYFKNFRKQVTHWWVNQKIKESFMKEMEQDQKQGDEKRGFFKRLLDKLDAAMKKMADEKSKGCGCGGGGKGGKCC